MYTIFKVVIVIMLLIALCFWCYAYEVDPKESFERALNLFMIIVSSLIINLFIQEKN